MKHKFNFYTEYNQFYLEDAVVKAEIEPSEFWNEDAFFSHLALDKGVVGIGTHCYGNVKGEIEVLDQPRVDINYKLYDHIVEGSIYVASGDLQILNCPDNHVELSLKLESGNYRVRVYGSNFGSVKETDLANDADNDYYRIEMWKSTEIGTKILKKYNGVSD